MECRFMSKFGEAVGWKVIYETAWSEIMENCKKKTQLLYFQLQTSQKLIKPGSYGYLDLIWVWRAYLAEQKSWVFFYIFDIFGLRLNQRYFRISWEGSINATQKLLCVLQSQTISEKSWFTQFFSFYANFAKLAQNRNFLKNLGYKYHTNISY